MRGSSLKTVYIIGSGFSVGVGGPLLYDLLSDRGRAEMLARFPKLKPCDLVYQAFWSHQRGNPRSNGNQVLWSHAEEFLDYVNTMASATGPRAAVLEQILQQLSRASYTGLPDFARLTAFAIAAECSFAKEQDPHMESWEPYVKWGASLDDSDTVVSFNYDTVLERLFELPESEMPCLKPWSLVWPKRSYPPGGKPLVAVFKLHGSTEWYMKGPFNSSTYNFDGNGYVDGPKDLEEAFEQGFTPLMGMPGPSKRTHCTQQFDKLWESARIRVANADVIVFMGYRFPPSDSFARTGLLKAIGDNASKYLRIHTVLGPNLGHENTVRLSKLLELTLKNAGRHPAPTSDERPGQNFPKSFALLQQPLYVEDYMTVMGPKELYGIGLE